MRPAGRRCGRAPPFLGVPRFGEADRFFFVKGFLFGEEDLFGDGDRFVGLADRGALVAPLGRRLSPPQTFM